MTRSLVLISSLNRLKICALVSALLLVRTSSVCIHLSSLLLPIREVFIIEFLNVSVDHLCFLSQTFADRSMKTMNSRLYIVDILSIYVLPHRVILLKILSVLLVHIREVFFEINVSITALSDGDCEICFDISQSGFFLQPCLFVN